jgi:hypothetical protein
VREMHEFYRSPVWPFNKHHPCRTTVPADYGPRQRILRASRAVPKWLTTKCFGAARACARDFVKTYVQTRTILRSARRALYPTSGWLKRLAPYCARTVALAEPKTLSQLAKRMQMPRRGLMRGARPCGMGTALRSARLACFIAIRQIRAIREAWMPYICVTTLMSVVITPLMATNAVREAQGYQRLHERGRSVRVLVGRRCHASARRARCGERVAWSAARRGLGSR